MRTVIAAALLLCVAGVAHANIVLPDAITFGPSYAMGPPAGFPWGYQPEIGSPMLVAGIISAVSGPFSELLPATPHELTFVIAGATYYGYGMWDDFVCSRGGTDYSYAGGMMSIFVDMTPDADFTMPSTFQDGELVLLAQVQGTNITDDDPDGICLTENYPDVRVFCSFSGGMWYHIVDGGVVNLKGEITNPDDVPAPLQAAGYVLRIDGSMDVIVPVAVEPTTWSRVKALYR